MAILKELPPDYLSPKQKEALRQLYEHFVLSTTEDSAVDAANIRSLAITVSSQPRNDNGLPKSDGGREHKLVLYANITQEVMNTSGNIKRSEVLSALTERGLNLPSASKDVQKLRDHSIKWSKTNKKLIKTAIESSVDTYLSSDIKAPLSTNAGKNAFSNVVLANIGIIFSAQISSSTRTADFESSEEPIPTSLSPPALPQLVHRKPEELATVNPNKESTTSTAPSTSLQASNQPPTAHKHIPQPAAMNPNTETPSSTTAPSVLLQFIDAFRAFVAARKDETSKTLIPSQEPAQATTQNPTQKKRKMEGPPQQEHEYMITGALQVDGYGGKRIRREKEQEEGPVWPIGQSG